MSECVPNHSPRDQSIATLAAIWARILQIPEIGADEDFFDLGGDSMLAAALFTEIEHEFGQNFPITTIYDAPTISRLADLLGQAAAPKFSHLVTLKPATPPAGPVDTPLFIVHGIGGSVMELAHVAARMTARGAVYGIQARGFDGEAPIDDVPTMVDRYLEAIRAVAPDGPYLLAGYSFGGLVALEMARKLRDSGATVDLLILIDSYPLASLWPWFLRFDCQCRKLWRRLGILASGGFQETWDFVTGWVTSSESGENRHRFPIEPGLPEEFAGVQHATERALLAYRPSYYPGDVIFVAADEPTPEFPRHPRAMWQELTGSLDVYGIAASHRGMMRGQADQLAGMLSMLFDRYLEAHAPRRARREAAAADI